MREKILQQIYDMYCDERKENDLIEVIYNELTTQIEELTGDGTKGDEAGYKICDITRAAFMDGANMMLDFMVGKRGVISEWIDKNKL